DQLLASRKLLKGVYVSRPDAEVHLRPFPATSFPLALVTAQAGAGKTTLLHHLAGEWAKGGASVLLARANAIEGADLMAWLRDELRLAASVTPEALAAGGASEDHPLILVLDGLNEHGEREALLASILEFATAIRDARHLKVLVSWRSERDDWTAAAKERAGLFLPAPGESDQKEGVPALHLTQLGTDEVKALWKRLSASDAARYKPRFTYDQLAERRRTAARMLTNPLVLRTFLEVYAGQGLPDSPSRRSLQHDWLVRLGERTGDGNRLLLDLARRCMGAGTQSLDLDALYDDADVASEMRRTDVAAPITRLLRREGVLALVPGDSVELVFSMDRYLEQAAGSALVADGRADTPADVLAAKEALGEWPMADEALRAAVEERMRIEGDRFLLDLIDEGGEAAASLAGEVLARRVLDSGDPEGIAALLMEDPTEGDFHAAKAAAAELDEELAYEAQCAFLEAVVGRIPASSSATEAEIQVRLALARALAATGREQEALTAAETTSARADGALEPCQALADAIQGVAWRLSTMGRHREALAIHRSTLELERRIHGEESGEVAGTLSAVGEEHESLGDYDAALDFRTQALEMERRIYGDKHPEVAGSLSAIGGVHEAKGDYDTALDFRTQALEMERRIYGDEHPEVASSISIIGGLHETRGDYDAALDFRTQALEMNRRIHGDEHPEVATSLSLIGGLHETKGDYDAALNFRTQALEMERRIYGDEHPKVATATSLLGGLQETKGDYEAALDFRAQALEMRRRIYGDEHPEVATSLSHVGGVHEAKGDYEAALDFRAQALEMQRRIYGDEHPQVATSLSHVGGVHEAKGDYDAALDFRTQALEMYRRIYGDEHPEVADSLAFIARLHQKTGEIETAATTRAQVLDLRRIIYGDQHPAVARSIGQLAWVNEDRGDYDAALDFRTQALEMERRIYGDEHPEVATSLSLIGGLHQTRGDYDAALDFRTQALEMERRIYGDQHPEVADSLSAIGGLRQTRGDYDAALDFRTQALEMQR
ncbi:tetratricopeptide repeat protein, partial [Planctomycetota bacterium]|nr:tetratricopeptide repeat protein [Planctomycetota bacterium]